MDLRHTGSDELIYIQTRCLTMTIKGIPYHPLFPGAEFKEKASTLRVVCEDDFDIALSGDPEPISSRSEGCPYVGVYQNRPQFFEQQSYELIIEPAEGYSVTFWHENYNVRKKVTPDWWNQFR